MENKQPKLLYTYNNMNELEEKMATHSNSLAWQSHEQRNLVGYIVLLLLLSHFSRVQLCVTP